MFKHKNIRMLALAVLLACSFVATSWAARTPKLTMLVVPARFSVLQVSFDMVKRFPVVLVSYQGDASTESPLLHAWNGQEWVSVTMEDFNQANFVQITPLRTVFVGDENLLPANLPEGSSWCPEVLNVPSIDTGTLITSFGKIFNFSSADWKWFAARYNLVLQDLNEERRKQSWYEKPFVEKTKPVQSEMIPNVLPVESLEVAPAEVEIPADTVSPQPLPVEESIPAPVIISEPPPAEVVVPESPMMEPTQMPAEQAIPAEPEGWQEKAVETESPK